MGHATNQVTAPESHLGICRTSSFEFSRVYSKVKRFTKIKELNSLPVLVGLLNNFCSANYVMHFVIVKYHLTK